MSNILINILTRTSGRPEGFKVALDSVRSQTYKNINHIIATDDINSEYYLQSENVNYMFFNRSHFANKVAPSPARRSSIKLPHNLYFNEMIKHVKEGWILYLDDDDRLSSNTIIEELVEQIKPTDDLLLWKTKFPSNLIQGSILPPNEGPPQPGQIDGHCHGVNSRCKDKIEWIGWNFSDFYVIDKLYNEIENKRWLDLILVEKSQIGMGKRGDISR